MPLDQRAETMSKKAPQPPPPDPMIGQIAQQNMAYSREALDFMKQTYADQAPRQAALDNQQLKLGEQLMTDAGIARERGNEAYDFYMKEARPVEQQMFRDAALADSEGNIANARGRAVADVNQAFSGAQQANLRGMGRYGLRPNADRMAAITSQLGAQQAASQAGAMTNSEQGIRDRAVAMRTNAANFGRGFPAQALQFGQAATGAGQQAFGNQMATNQAFAGNAAQMMGGYGMAGGINAQAGSLLNQSYATQVQGWGTGQNVAAQQGASNMQGIGQMAGMAAAYFL
jgi:hypothetical protein